jgi:hypothetical protein
MSSFNLEPNKMFSLLRRFHEQADYHRSLANGGPYGPEPEPIVFEEPSSGVTGSDGHLPSFFRFTDDNHIVVNDNDDHIVSNIEHHPRSS